MDDDLKKQIIRYDNLLRRYLDVCNQALELNKNRFPFQQIFEAVKEKKGGRLIELKIESYDPSYVIKIENDQVAFDHHNSCETCHCDREWIVQEGYLLGVVQNPEPHIENPARLDWSWMYG